MDAFRSSRQRRESRSQEKRVARELGGRTQAASGATRLGGGADVRAPGFRIECKYTEKDTYTLKLADLNKLKSQAVKTLEQPVMQIEFRRGPVSLRHRFALVRRTSFPGASASSAGKSFPVELNRVLEQHAKKLPWAVMFAGANEWWQLIDWLDFLKEAGVA